MMSLLTKLVGRVGAIVVIVPMLLFAGGSCTDLSETPHDALTPENAFKSA